MTYELARKWSQYIREHGTWATMALIEKLPEDEIQAIYDDCESAFSNDALGDLHSWAATIVSDIHGCIWHPRWRADEENAPRLTTNQIPRKEYVYLLWTSAGIYKIGYSANPKSRLTTYKAMPFKCDYVCLIESENGRELEAQLHKRFKDKVLPPKREWFALTPNDVEYIKSLAVQA
jgi:hypothetical protein